MGGELPPHDPLHLGVAVLWSCDRPGCDRDPSELGPGGEQELQCFPQHAPLPPPRVFLGASPPRAPGTEARESRLGLAPRDGLERVRTPEHDGVLVVCEERLAETEIRTPTPKARQKRVEKEIPHFSKLSCC